MNFILSMRVAGSLCILSGINMYKTGWDNKWGVHISHYSAIFVSFLGCILFIASFVIKKNRGIMICENCKQKYKTEYIQIPVCPKCDGKLVEYKEPIDNGTGKPAS